MGFCLSCLRRTISRANKAETTLLLADDDQTQYGTARSNPLASESADASHFEQEQKRLETLCNHATRKLIDVANLTESTNIDQITLDIALLFSERFPAQIQFDAKLIQPPAYLQAVSEDEKTWLVTLGVVQKSSDEADWNSVSLTEGTHIIVYPDE